MVVSVAWRCSSRQDRSSTVIITLQGKQKCVVSVGTSIASAWICNGLSQSDGSGDTTICFVSVPGRHSAWIKRYNINLQSQRSCHDSKHRPRPPLCVWYTDTVRSVADWMVRFPLGCLWSSISNGNHVLHLYRDAAAQRLDKRQSQDGAFHIWVNAESFKSDSQGLWRWHRPDHPHDDAPE